MPVSLEHPYVGLNGGDWLRGNLHTHTTRSDGQRAPQDVIDDYAARGYGFLAISDHDIPATAADYAGWDSRGMIFVTANEVSANGPHVHHVGCDRRVEPHADRQRVIDEINADNGLVIVNHPNWQEAFDHCSIANMRAWQNYHGMEIYNGVISRLHGSPYATNKWDMLLAEGRRLWGFAHDDSHASVGDVELGWNVAYVKDRSAAGVIEALRNGRFYCSTGVQITGITVRGNRIRIDTTNASRITALAQTGRRIATSDGRSIEIDVPDSARYVRFECWGDGERFAWTQPFWTKPGA